MNVILGVQESDSLSLILPQPRTSLLKDFFEKDVGMQKGC